MRVDLEFVGVEEHRSRGRGCRSCRPVLRCRCRRRSEPSGALTTVQQERRARVVDRWTRSGRASGGRTGRSPGSRPRRAAARLRSRPARTSGAQRAVTADHEDQRGATRSSRFSLFEWQRQRARAGHREARRNFPFADAARSAADGSCRRCDRLPSPPAPKRAVPPAARPCTTAPPSRVTSRT